MGKKKKKRRYAGTQPHIIYRVPQLMSHLLFFLGIDAPLVPLRQSDMCLVCIAFASWVLKSASPQGADTWKAGMCFYCKYNIPVSSLQGTYCLIDV